MKNMEDRYIDKELSPEEEKNFLMSVEADPSLKERLLSLQRTVSLMEDVKKIPPPPDFTEHVISKLPDSVYQERDRRKKIYDFFFTPKILKWNMATAIVSFLLIVTTGLLVWTQIERNGDVPPLYQAAAKGTVPVRFSIYIPDAKNVSMVGDFNNWQTEDITLTEREKKGIWTVDIYLKPGRYNYMFLVDGQRWVTDPNADTLIDDGFGNKNAVIKVGDV